MRRTCQTPGGSCFASCPTHIYTTRPKCPTATPRPTGTTVRARTGCTGIRTSSSAASAPRKRHPTTAPSRTAPSVRPLQPVWDLRPEQHGPTSQPCAARLGATHALRPALTHPRHRRPCRQVHSMRQSVVRRLARLRALQRAREDSGTHCLSCLHGSAHSGVWRRLCALRARPVGRSRCGARRSDPDCIYILRL